MKQKLKMKRNENKITSLLRYIFKQTCILPLYKISKTGDTKISLGLFSFVIAGAGFSFYAYNIYNFLQISSLVKDQDGLILSIGLYIQILVGSSVLISTQFLSLKNTRQIKVLSKNLQNIFEKTNNLNISKSVNRKLSTLAIALSIINSIANFIIYAERNRDAFGFRGVSVSVLYDFPMMWVLIVYSANLFLVDKMFMTFKGTNKFLKKYKKQTSNNIIADQVKRLLHIHEDLSDMTYLLENIYGVLGAMLLFEIMISGVFFSFYTISVIMAKLIQGKIEETNFPLLTTFWNLSTHVYIIILMIVLCDQCMSEVIIFNT